MMISFTLQVEHAQIASQNNKHFKTLPGVNDDMKQILQNTKLIVVINKLFIAY